jgi:hypothetical protein
MLKGANVEAAEVSRNLLKWRRFMICGVGLDSTHSVCA